MTDQELIARYMGFELEVFPTHTIVRGNPICGNNTMCKLTDLDYSTNWTMLMTVVCKILDEPWNPIDAQAIEPGFRTFGMREEVTNDFMVRLNGEFIHKAPTLLEATYLAVIDHIKMKLC